MKIDRNTILNNEMYSLYCKLENENYRNQIDADDEYRKEEQAEAELASKWLNGEYIIDADEMYRLSGIKRAYNEQQLEEYCINPSDKELCKQIVWIEREVSGYCMFPSRIYYIVNNILELKDYKRLWQLMCEFRYVPLQYGIILDLKSHDDFMAMLNTIDKSSLSHPTTIICMMRDRWFDWIVQACHNLSTYKKDDRIYNQKKYKHLIEEGQEVKTVWDTNLNDLLKEGYERFCNNLGNEDMLAWVYNIRKRLPYSNNDYSRKHDEVVDKIREIAMRTISKDNTTIETSNLHLQTAIIESKLQENLINRESAVKYWEQISANLESSNFIKNGEIYSEDEKCMDTIVKLWILIFENLEDGVIDALHSSRTHFEGWNVDYSLMYDKVKYEAFLLSVAVKATFLKDTDEQEKMHYWKTICEYVTTRMHNCDNEHMCNDYLCLPLVLAEFYARKFNFSGLSYLRNLILTRVQSINTVLKIFVMASSEPVEELCDLLKERIEIEWSSCRVLMQLRRQTNQIAQYEEVIKKMTCLR